MTALLLVVLATDISLKEVNELELGCHFGINCKENQTFTFNLP